MLVGLALWALWAWWRRNTGGRSVPWKAVGWVGVAFVVVLLPLLAVLVERYGWEGVAVAVTVAIAAAIPVLAIVLPESPGSIGLGPYGMAAEPQRPTAVGNPFTIAMMTLFRAARSLDFWLLTSSFGICGFSTNGLINTHLIAYCADHGISEVTGASVLAVLGAFSLVGAAGSGWLCDRYNPRVLLFWYYGLRGLSLAVLPFTSFDVVSLSMFSIFYGLDWVATGPATFALTNEVFGRRDAPIIVSWIFAGHQIGGALAAFGAGAVRTLASENSALQPDHLHQTDQERSGKAHQDDVDRHGSGDRTDAPAESALQRQNHDAGSRPHADPGKHREEHHDEHDPGIVHAAGKELRNGGRFHETESVAEQPPYRSVGIRRDP